MEASDGLASGPCEEERENTVKDAGKPAEDHHASGRDGESEMLPVALADRLGMTGEDFEDHGGTLAISEGKGSILAKRRLWPGIRVITLLIYPFIPFILE